MKDLIYKYLKQNFYVDDYYETIKPRRKNEDDLYTFYGSHGLTDELKKVFGLSREELMPYVEGWVEQYYDDFRFEGYWNRPRVIMNVSMELLQDLRAHGIDVTPYLERMLNL